MAEYPSEYELDIVLRDGGGARVRPIKPEDAGLIRDFFETLGPESRYFRFFRIKETLEPKEVEFFTQVDYADRMALIALLDGKMIAVARYDREGHDATAAEVAFSVADKHQGRGIGTQLLQLLTTPRPNPWHRALPRLRPTGEPSDDAVVSQLGLRDGPHPRRWRVHGRFPGGRERRAARGRSGAGEASGRGISVALVLPQVGGGDRGVE